MHSIGDLYNDLSMFEQSDFCFTFEESPLVLKDQCHRIVLLVAQVIEKKRKGV